MKKPTLADRVTRLEVAAAAEPVAKNIRGQLTERVARLEEKLSDVYTEQRGLIIQYGTHAQWPERITALEQRIGQLMQKHQVNAELVLRVLKLEEAMKKQPKPKKTTKKPSKKAKPVKAPKLPRRY